jgi:hypothetical protein
MDRELFIQFPHPINFVNPVKIKIPAVSRDNHSSVGRGETGWTGFSEGIGAVQGAGQPSCLVADFGLVKSGFYPC